MKAHAWKVLVLAAAAALVPLLTPAYLTFQLTLALGIAIALIGLNVLIGWAGQISLGHGAFFAAGAYGLAILVDRGVPWIASLPLATAGCAALGYALGKPALRLERAYLGLATFALALAAPQLLRFRKWESVTGGAQGIQINKPEGLGLGISVDVWMYWLALAAAVGVYAATAKLLRGPHGLELQALREHPLAAASCGIDTAAAKTKAFVLSAACAGLGGGLYALNVQLVTPDSFTLFLSLTMLIGVVVGGLGSIPGAFLGALFIQFTPAAADRLSTSAPWAIFGIAALAVVLIEPRGLAGVLQRTWNFTRPGRAARTH